MYDNVNGTVDTNVSVDSGSQQYRRGCNKSVTQSDVDFTERHDQVFKTFTGDNGLQFEELSRPPKILCKS